MTAYLPRHPSTSEHIAVRGLSYHVRRWGAANGRPVWLLHGWMDVGASYQFLADELLALNPNLSLFAPDWRGFGKSTAPQPCDAYWFADYLADFDALLRHYHGDTAPVDLVAHSMGGNVAMLYAGARPARIASLVNLDGTGLAGGTPDQAPERYAKWLDEIIKPEGFAPYKEASGVASRLMKNNPRLPEDKASFLAQHWGAPAADGSWHLQADPAHKRSNPLIYRVEEILACWAAITAPVLMVEPADGSTRRWLKLPDDYDATRLAKIARLSRLMVKDAGHMLHHDQPALLAQAILNHILPPTGAAHGA